MPKLFALLIGICEYPIYHHRLEGCLNDVSAMHVFLKKYSKDMYEYLPEILRNKDASRQGIIDSFKHFDEATKGDICIFYYSGHGSQASSDWSFWNNPSEMEESIVCHDSRTEGGRDLMDKELSYLIWNATENKGVHFLSIMDSCHSGSATRQLNLERSRLVEPSFKPEKKEDYLGFKKWDLEKLSPPSGRHIHFSASRDNETAKEKWIDGEYRGVFTKCLIEVLEAGGISQSYAEIINRTRIKVKNRTRQQNPKVESFGVKKTEGFLGVDVSKGMPYYIHFDSAINEWILDAGQVQSIAPSTINIRTEWVLSDIPSTPKVFAKEVRMNDTIIGGMDSLDKEEIYKAWMTQTAYSRLPIGISEMIMGEPRTQIINTLNNNPNLRFTSNITEAKYLIGDLNGALILVRHGEEVPVFKRVDGYNESPDKIKSFLHDVNSVANWEQVLELHNPQKQIEDREFKIEFSILKDSNDYTLLDPERIIQTDLENPISLNYLEGDAAFRLEIENTSNDILYVGALYLGSDFGIYDDFLEVQPVAKGAKTRLTYNDEKGEHSNLPVHIPSEYHTWGINQITEYVKIFIGKTPLDISRLCQTELKLDKRDITQLLGGSRAIGREVEPVSREAWRVIDLELAISKVHKEAKLKSDTSTRLENAHIEVPSGFEGKAYLNTMEESTKSVNFPIPPFLRQNPFSPITRSLNQSVGFEVLELFDVVGEDNLTVDSPILIKFDEYDQKNELIIPIGFDTETGLYYPLGSMDEKGILHLEQIPSLTRSADTRSLGGSIKIFFKKLTYPLLKKDFDYPRLCLVTVDDDENVTYRSSDINFIKPKIEEDSCQNIAVFIHGIIGDTKEMTKLIRRVNFSDGATLNDYYDTVLTFDYENLNTSIEETARDLKKRLLEIGLGSNHKKRLHIYAHSMGGLVSRWFIEKEGGSEIVNHLFQFGTPNSGSPWSDVRELVVPLISKVINGVGLLQPYLLPLSLLGRITGKTQETLKQLNKDSNFIKNIKNEEASIPYTLFCGNTSLTSNQDIENSNFFIRFKNRPHYKFLDHFLFQEFNDLAVSVESQKSVPDSTMVEKIEIPCNHLSYFADPISIGVVTPKLETILIKKESYS